MYNLSLKIIAQLKKRNHLQNEDEEIVAYGLFSILFNIYCFLVCVIIGSFLKSAFEAVVFFCAFLFVRRYAGGYHAKKEWACMIITTVSIFLSLVFIHLIAIFAWLNVISLCLSLLYGIVICIFAPLEADNKPLNHKEKKKYKAFSIIRVSIVSIIILFSFFKFNTMVSSICVAVIYEGTLVVGGYVQKKSPQFNDKNAVL